MNVRRTMRSVVGWLGVVGLGAALVTGCPRRPDEPDPTPRKAGDSATSPVATPSPSPRPTEALSAPVPSSGDAGVNAPFTAREKRELHEKLHNELCELAAKHQNVVYGRPELDKKGTLLITGCLFEGNTAWYKCIMGTSTPTDFEWCSQRYLRPADDAK